MGRFNNVKNLLASLTGNVGTSQLAAASVTADKLGNAVRVTTDQASIVATYASTTLLASLLANTNYTFHAYIYFTNITSSSINIEIKALAAGASLIVADALAVSIATADVTAAGVATAVTTAIFTTAPVYTSGIITISGVITVGATATTLEIDFANPAAAGTATVKAGSFIVVSAVA